MDGLAFSPEALEANHRGHLSPAQKRELQAYVDSLTRAFTSRLLFGQGTHGKELQAGRVLLFEGVTVRKEWEPEDKEFQIEAASRQDGFKTFWSLEDLYNFAPEKCLVRVYYLPRTSWAVNLQRLSGRPLTRQDLEPELLRQRALEAGDRRRIPDPVERAYFAADVEAAHRKFRSYLPGGAPLPALSGRAADPRLLAASLIGQWWNPGLTIDLRADGTITVVGPWVAMLASALADPGNRSAAPTRGGSRGRSRADMQSGPTTASGTWSVGADGRLQTGALGTPLVADAVVAGNELTLVIDGKPWRFERLFFRGAQMHDLSPEIDRSRPHAARMYDYFLGGENNFPADREAAAEVLRHSPSVRVAARENRAFLGRAVRYLTDDAGIRQFLDIGSGLPAAGNVHAVAQASAPSSRVVYADNDPLVLVHARALLASAPEGRTAYIQADLRDPAAILADPVTRDVLDFGQPIGLILAAILHFVRDEDNPRQVIATLLDALPSGSYLIASHLTTEHDPAVTSAGQRVMERAGIPMQKRHSGEFEALAFQGLDLVPPGVVLVSHWRPDGTRPLPPPAEVNCYGGVARKP